MGAAEVAVNPSLSGMAFVVFEDRRSAVSELDRAVTKLGLRGLICNSHVNGRYLDDPTSGPGLPHRGAHPASGRQVRQVVRLRTRRGCCQRVSARGSG
nr:hypothetical protein GCM10017611_04070 [Rhodococcus wratislaviensis]